MKKHPTENRPRRMTWKPDTACRDRRPDAKEITVAEAGFDLDEIAVLSTARFYWQTFAQPATQSWMGALETTEHNFGPVRGGQVGREILATVQAMRMTRMSCFRFNNPACNGCAVMLSEHERQFMGVFRAIRDGRSGAAKTHAMLLCEGQNSDMFIRQMTELVHLICDIKNELRTKPVAAYLH